jgi:hypothetical protein
MALAQCPTEAKRALTRCVMHARKRACKPVKPAHSDNNNNNNNNNNTQLFNFIANLTRSTKGPIQTHQFYYYSCVLGSGDIVNCIFSPAAPQRVLSGQTPHAHAAAM